MERSIMDDMPEEPHGQTSNASEGGLGFGSEHAMAINSENGDGDLQGLAEQGGAPLHHIQIPEVDHTRSPWVRSSEWRLLSRQRYFTEQLEDWKSFRRWQVLARRGCLAEIEECVPPEAQAFNYFLCVFSGNAGSYPAAAKLLLEESGQVVEVEFRPMYEAANQSMLTEWLEYLVYACAMEYRCKQLATQLWGPLSGVAKAWRLLRDEKVIDQSQEDSFNAAPEEAYKAVQNDVNELTFLRGVLRAKLAAADASGENTWVNFERNQIFQQVEWADRSLKLAIRRKLQVEVFRRCGSNEDRLRRQSLRVGWIRSQLDRLRADGPVAALPSRIIQSSPALPVQGPVSPFGAPSRSDVRIREGNIARPGLVQPNRQYVGDGLWLPYNFTNLHHELPLELGVNSGGGSAVASSSTAPAGPSAPGRYSVAPQSRTTNGYLTTTVYNITHLLPELGGDGNWAITLDTSAADGQVRPALSAGGSLVTLLDASDVSGLPTVAAFGSDNNHNRTILPGSGASTVSPSPAPESTATAAAASFKEIPVPQLPTRPPLPRLPTSRFPETALSPMPSLPTVIPTTPASPRPIPSEPFVTRHALLPLRPVPTRPGRSNKALSSGASACAQERTGNIAQPESSSQAAKRPLSATGDDDDQQPPRGSKRRPISIGDNAGQGNSDRAQLGPLDHEQPTTRTCQAHGEPSGDCAAHYAEIFSLLIACQSRLETLQVEMEMEDARIENLYSEARRLEAHAIALEEEFGLDSCYGSADDDDDDEDNDFDWGDSDDSDEDGEDEEAYDDDIDDGDASDEDSALGEDF